MIQGHRWGVIAILFAAVVWGTTGTAATFAPDVSAAAIGAAAMGLGGIAQALWAGRGILNRRARLWQQRRLLVIGALAVAVYPLAFYGAMRLAGVTVGTVVTIGSAPLLSALIEYLLDRRRLTLRWSLGAAVGLIGMGLICLAENAAHGETLRAPSVPLGVLLGLIGGFTYALYSWSARKMMLQGTGSTVAMGATFGLGGLLLMPVLAADRLLATLKIRLGGFPYHLALLQLEHDSSFQKHSPFDTMADFLELVIEGFAKGAPQHHHLVIKAHPLEDGRVPVRRDVKRLARAFGVSDRVHFVRGGKLAQLLNDTRSAVTVNSTAGQQVLWRGIPLKVFGRAVYSQPEFVSDQPLPDFFATASRPDNRAYKDYRRYLLETSQVPGGFYAARGRRQLLRQVVDMMLAPDDPYDALEQGTAAPRQQLRVVT